MNRKVSLNFTEKAFTKMSVLLDYFDSEIGWMGTAQKIGECKYRVTDIYVYPQTVTGATIETDQGEYAMWYCQLPDDVISSLCFHGHSHVRMEPIPSGTDMRDQKRDIDSLDGKGFRIFMIANKQGRTHISIYDMDAGEEYENEDIQLSVRDYSVEDFLELAKTMVKKKTKALKTKRYRVKKGEHYESC